MTEQAVAAPIGKMIMSGHCAFPQSANPALSHERCAVNGGGSTANPTRTYCPCPCPCHYGEEFECGGCGQPIREALAWPLDVDGDLRYTHIARDGRAIGEDCTARTVSRNDEADSGDSGLQRMLDVLEGEADEAEPLDDYESMLAEFDDD